MKTSPHQCLVELDEAEAVTAGAETAVEEDWEAVVVMEAVVMAEGSVVLVDSGAEDSGAEEVVSARGDAAPEEAAVVARVATERSARSARSAEPHLCEY